MTGLSDAWCGSERLFPSPRPGRCRYHLTRLLAGEGRTHGRRRLGRTATVLGPVRPYVGEFERELPGRQRQHPLRHLTMSPTELPCASGDRVDDRNRYRNSGLLALNGDLAFRQHRGRRTLSRVAFEVGDDAEPTDAPDDAFLASLGRRQVPAEDELVADTAARRPQIELFADVQLSFYVDGAALRRGVVVRAGCRSRGCLRGGPRRPTRAR